MNKNQALLVASIIPSWMEPEEREKLYDLAREVKADGLIVEVGCLYGASTALLGLAAPKARLSIFDDFSWSPLPEMKACRETLFNNLFKVGLENDIELTEGDSRVLAKGWDKPIDLLWIDGGHSFEFIFADLCNLGPHAEVIACHDYDNPTWETIRRAVERFLELYPIFAIASVTGTLVELRRKA